MNKYLFLILVLSAALFAGLSDIQTLYDQKNYVAAIEKAKSSTSLYGDARLHILWGKSAEALGNYEEAMSAYERVLMITPNNSTVRVKLAKLYAESGRPYLTKQLLEDSEDYQLTAEEKDMIVALVNDDNKPLSAFASIGFGYDSNINVSPGDLDIPTSEEEISTKFVRYQAGVSYTYKLESIENLYVRSGAAFSYQDNEAGYFNLFAGVVNAGFGYRGESYDIYIPLKYSRIHYLNRDLMESIGVDPNVNLVFSNSVIGNLNMRYSERSYIQDADKLMDDSVLGAGIGLYWIFGDNLAYFKVNYDDYTAEHRELSHYIQKNSISLATGINYQLNDMFTASGTYRYRNTSYDDVLPSSSEKRKDDHHQLDLELSGIVMEDMEATLSYSNSMNESNLQISEYNKNIVMCNLKYNY